jgi:cell division protein FtsN
MPMILLDSSGKRYRVVEQIVESKDEAIKASNRLKKNNVDNWILTL